MKLLEEAPCTSVPGHPSCSMRTQGGEDTSLPGLVGMIAVQISSHLSNILRSHLERGILLSGRHYDLLGRLNFICGHIQLTGSGSRP